MISALISYQASSQTTSHQEPHVTEDLHRGEKGGSNGFPDGKPGREMTQLAAAQPAHGWVLETQLWLQPSLFKASQKPAHVSACCPVRQGKAAQTSPGH